MQIEKIVRKDDNSRFKTQAELEWFFSNLDGSDLVITEGGKDKVLILRNDFGFVTIELDEESDGINNTYVDSRALAKKYFQLFDEKASYREVRVKITYEILPRQE